MIYADVSHPKLSTLKGKEDLLSNFYWTCQVRYPAYRYLL